LGNWRYDMQSRDVYNGTLPETYPIRTIADEYTRDPKRMFSAANSANLPIIEYMEAITQPSDREQNELTTVEAVLWYMCGIDMQDTGYMNSNQLIRLGDMTTTEFDLSPQGKLLYNLMDFDYMWSLIRGSEDESFNQAAHGALNPANQTNRSPMALGLLEPGEPWNEYQTLMMTQSDTWGPSIDYRDIVGEIRVTNQKEVRKPYRDMTYDQAQQLRTAEGVRHMIVEIGLSKETFALSGRGVQMRCTYDYLTNPSLSVRDFRFEVERIGIAMRIKLFLEIVDFLITQASVQAPNDALYGGLTSINAEKWLQWRKLWNRYQLTTILGDPVSITKWELAMLGKLPNDSVMGVNQLIQALNETRNSRQLNQGTRIPNYGWIDNVYDTTLYAKFTESNDSGLNNGQSGKYLLCFNRPTASRLWFRRQSRQDESGRDTQSRMVYRDLHVEIGKDRPEKPTTGKSNIIRTQIS